jgi:hypothetical protein
VLDPSLWTNIVARYVKRPPWMRPPIYLIAESPDRAAQREWLASVLGGLAEGPRARAVSRLLEQENFLATYNELAATEILLRSGHVIDFEPELGGLTPDAVLLDAAGRPAVIVEVSTRFRSDADRREERKWAELKHRATKIPVPIGMAVTGENQRATPAPDSGTAKRLVIDLQRHLETLKPIPFGHALEVGGYEFHLVNPIPGTHAMLTVPVTAGWQDVAEVLDAVQAKVHRYASVADAAGAALIVVIAAELQSPVTIDLLRAALAGQQATTLTLDLFNVSEIKFDVNLHERDEPSVFHPALSAVGWLAPGDSDPGVLTIFPVPSASRPVALSTSPQLIVARALRP